MEQERGTHMQEPGGRTGLSTRVPWRHFHYCQHLAYSFLWLKFTLLIKFHLLDASVYLGSVIFAKSYLPPTLSLIANWGKNALPEAGQEPMLVPLQPSFARRKVQTCLLVPPTDCCFPPCLHSTSLHSWCFTFYFRQIDLVLYRGLPTKPIHLFILSHPFGE